MAPRGIVLAAVFLLLWGCSPKPSIPDPWAKGPAEWYSTAAGVSMEPTIYPGDICHWVPTPYADLCGKRQWTLGDVVAVLTPTMIYSHRLIWKTPDGWVTQGDADPIPDAVLVTADNYRGRMIALVQKG